MCMNRWHYSLSHLFLSILLAYLGALHAMVVRRVAVIGSTSRGIGSEFARQLIERHGYAVIGLQRSAAPPFSSPHLRVLDGIDAERPESLLGLRARVEALLPTFLPPPAPASLDLLINASAILGDGASTPGPERSADKISPDWMRRSLDVNVLGHVEVTRQLLPLLYRKNAPGAGDVATSSPASTEASRVVNISARVGSIGDNKTGGWYSYRMSKAALNMFTRTLAIETRRHGVWVLSIHPGTTQTALSAPFAKNVRADKLFTAERSVQGMLDVILRAGQGETGKFFAYDGSEIEW